MVAMDSHNISSMRRQRQFTSIAPTRYRIPRSLLEVAMADKATSGPGRVAPSRANIRYKVDPRDVPPEKAARRMHLTLADFEMKLPELLARGFPQRDPTTGMFDLEAIDQWMSARHCQAPGLTAEAKPRNAQEVFNERLATRGTR